MSGHTNIPGVVLIGGGFVQVTREVMDALVGNPNALIVYLRLLDHANPRTGEGAYPSRKRLAQYLGHKSAKQVDKALRTLAEIGLVGWYHRYINDDGETSLTKDDEFNRMTSNGYTLSHYPGPEQRRPMPPNEVLKHLGVGSNNSLPPTSGNDDTPSRGVGNESSLGVGNESSLGWGSKAPTNNNPLITPQTPLPPAAESGPDGTDSAPVPEGESSPRSGGADAPADPDRTSEAAAVIVDGWSGQRPAPLPDGQARRLRAHVATALESGRPETAIRRALNQWDDGSSFSPNRLPHLIAAQSEILAAEGEQEARQKARREETAEWLSERRTHAERVRGERAAGRGLVALLSEARRRGALDGPEPDTPTVPPPGAPKRPGGVNTRISGPSGNPTTTEGEHQ